MHRKGTVRAGALKVNAIAQHSDPASVILDVAQHEKIDLIILGSRGLGTIKGLFRGSVSNKVNQLSDCCCITVK
ncbi:MAG: universal stress protein [Alphaproteobacteria bacterium]|nr:universal stress protein [Alphaproteobacteria bacterium]MBT7943519.1 universal stress protein [Alphaproteobacteria bacterium]